jgi:hypothetical protein
MSGSTLADKTTKQHSFQSQILLSLDLDFSRSWRSIISVSRFLDPMSFILGRILAALPISSVVTNVNNRAATRICIPSHSPLPRLSILRINIQTVESIPFHREGASGSFASGAIETAWPVNCCWSTLQTVRWSVQTAATAVYLAKPVRSASA